MNYELNQPTTADEQAIRAVVAAAGAAIGQPACLVAVIVADGSGKYRSLFHYTAQAHDMARVLNELAGVCLARAETQLTLDRLQGGT